MKIPFVRSSTRKFTHEAWQAPSFSFSNWLHGYVYGKWPYLYIGIGTGHHRAAKLLRPFYLLFSRLNTVLPKARSNEKEVTFSDTYHGKVIPLDQARKIVTVNREITVEDLEQVVPYTRARSIILKNPESIVALDCPCRASRPNPCTPIDVCLIIGEPFASFITEHHPNRSRRITREEAVAVLEAEHKRGHVHHAFFKEAMLNRFYAICNCCSCCCGAIGVWNKGTPMLASSGYNAEIDPEKCTNCGTCNRFCQFEAIMTSSVETRVDLEKCLGCGVCVDKCRVDAVQLKRNPDKGVPLEIEKLFSEALQAQEEDAGTPKQG